MAKPVILAVDDDPQVLRAVERDLRAESGETALDTLGKRDHFRLGAGRDAL